MTDYYINSDNIDGNEQKYVDCIAEKLEAAGHTVTKLGIGPYPNQNYSLTSAAQGKVDIMIAGGVCMGTLCDFLYGMEKGYYKCSKFIVAFVGWIGNKYTTCEYLKNYRQKNKAWDDSFSPQWLLDKYGVCDGRKSVAELCAEHENLSYVCGDNCEELARKILKGMGDDSDSESEPSTIRDVLKELMYHWDGQAELKCYGDTIYINKIPPQTDATLEITEGVNLVKDGLTIHDYYPDTINYLVVTHNFGDPIIKTDQRLIDRFGEKKREVEATKKIQVQEEVESSDTDTDTDTDTEDTDTSSDSDDESTTETKWVTKEVPVESYEEAVAFADAEWGRIRRDDGHTIECKVIPSPDWRIGEWVKVYIPSYYEDCYMYITKVSNTDSGDGDWACSLTLADFPPSFGEYEEGEEEEDSEDEEDTEEDSEDTE